MTNPKQQYSVGVLDSEGHIVAVLETDVKFRKAQKRLKTYSFAVLAGSKQTRPSLAERQKGGNATGSRLTKPNNPQ